MTKSSAILHLYTIYCILFVSQIECLGLSSKLDFGEDEATTKSSTPLQNGGNLVKTLLTLSHTVTNNKKGNEQEAAAISGLNSKQGTFDFKTISLPKSSDNRKETKSFENIGQICTSGNCNNENKKEISTGDTISTDIHVHVETNVGGGVTQNHTNSTLEGDDDVPIIVGYGGTSNHEDSAPLKPDYHRPKPSYSTSPKQQDTRLNPESLVVSTLDPSFQFNRRVEGIPGVISIVDSNLAETPQLNSASRIHVLTPANVNHHQHHYQNEAKFKPNGIELQISYFEPSFNNHYFRENASPQFVWYPKNGIKHTAATGYLQSNNGWKSQTCTCSNPGGLHWYPSQTWNPHSPPGASISDKLNFNDRT